VEPFIGGNDQQGQSHRASQCHTKTKIQRRDETAPRMETRTISRGRSWRNARARRRPLSVGSRRGGKPNSCSSFRHTRENRRMNPAAEKILPGLRPTGYREHSLAKRNGACHPWWPGLPSNRENPHCTKPIGKPGSKHRLHG
jgi:hypothetical protein